MIKSKLKQIPRLKLLEMLCLGSLCITIPSVIAMAISDNDNVDVDISKETQPLNERMLTILSSKMDETVSTCYAELFQNPDNQTTPMNGDICDKAILFFKENCKVIALEGCNSQYFKDYLKAMGQ